MSCFPIYRPKELAHQLGTSPPELRRIAYGSSGYYEPLELSDPRRPEKPREVLSVRKPLSSLQSRLYRTLLLPSLSASRYSHGGRSGRSIKTNASEHRASRYVYKTDISNFYPSIHDRRVYRLFAERLGCSPEVADLCCRLTTHRHHLALGLATSPILADSLLSDVDCRISAACRKAGLVYSRYVDDVTISGPYDLGRSGIGTLLNDILRTHGFFAKRSKTEVVPISDATITGLRVVRGRLDVAADYVAELERQLADLASLAEDGPFTGPYFLRQQVLGRVRYVAWVNSSRSRRLKRLCRRINWAEAQRHAQRRGLVALKKSLRKPTHYSSAV